MEKVGIWHLYAKEKRESLVWVVFLFVFVFANEVIDKAKFKIAES